VQFAVFLLSLNISGLVLSVDAHAQVVAFEYADVVAELVLTLGKQINVGEDLGRLNASVHVLEQHVDKVVF